MSNIDALLAARHDPLMRLDRLPNPPANAEEAYATQFDVMAHLGPIGGWKVGFSAPNGPFTCAPLPASGIVATGARVVQDECPDRGIEAEIAVKMAAPLPPRDEPYSTDEVRDAIETAHPTIELLQSRFANVDTVDPHSNLADSLSHHGLVVGPAIPGWQSVDLTRESVRVLMNGAEVKQGTGNPGGDLLRLVTWLANNGAVRAGGLQPGQIITTGSWTGKDIAPPNAHVEVIFNTCGKVDATYT